jgi:hypothetical protein
MTYNERSSGIDALAVQRQTTKGFQINDVAHVTPVTYSKKALILIDVIDIDLVSMHVRYVHTIPVCEFQCYRGFLFSVEKCPYSVNYL